MSSAPLHMEHKPFQCYYSPIRLGLTQALKLTRHPHKTPTGRPSRPSIVLLHPLPAGSMVQQPVSGTEATDTSLGTAVGSIEVSPTGVWTTDCITL